MFQFIQTFIRSGYLILDFRLSPALLIKITEVTSRYPKVVLEHPIDHSSQNQLLLLPHMFIGHFLVLS